MLLGFDYCFPILIVIITVLVNAGHQILFVARINRSSLFGELLPIKEVGDSSRSPLL